MKNTIPIRNGLAMAVIVGLVGWAAVARGQILPATATLVLKTNTAVLDPAQAGAVFAGKLKALKPGAEFPAPPSVDLVLRITNTSPPVYRNPEVPVILSPKSGVGIGDADKVAEIELLVEGPGAITMEGKASIGKGYQGIYLEIRPGESVEIPITNLSFSAGGKNKAAYWTEPGTYTLKATYSSIYQSTMGGGRGGAFPFKVTSDPVTIKVTRK
jgi:hypothetical protein